MNGMIFRPFRKQNSSQKNTKTVYSEYSYSGIVPKERALPFTQKSLLLMDCTFTGKEQGRGDLRNSILVTCTSSFHIFFGVLTLTHFFYCKTERSVAMFISCFSPSKHDIFTKRWFLAWPSIELNLGGLLRWIIRNSY